jgi:hypothetical protein
MSCIFQILFAETLPHLSGISFYPLSYFPQGGKDFTPSPMGEGWDGGLKLLKKTYSHKN